MRLFNTLISKIFGGAASPPPASPVVAAGSPVTPGAGGPLPAAPVATAVPAPQSVDIGAILDGLAAKSSEKLDWKRSIVDLMKLVGMDSSLAARKELAKELHYSGDTSDSATMNIWLHKEVLKKLAENGGKVPGDLLD